MAEAEIDLYNHRDGFFFVAGAARGFCPKEKCPHYGKATKYPRKCYYEPQCFWGDIDALGDFFRLVIRLGREK